MIFASLFQFVPPIDSSHKWLTAPAPKARRPWCEFTVLEFFARTLRGRAFVDNRETGARGGGASWTGNEQKKINKNYSNRFIAKPSRSFVFCVIGALALRPP
jgi:hypothetical protein